jgi:hypothetical protein
MINRQQTIGSVAKKSCQTIELSMNEIANVCFIRSDDTAMTSQEMGDSPPEPKTACICELVSPGETRGSRRAYPLEK